MGRSTVLAGYWQIEYLPTRRITPSLRPRRLETKTLGIIYKSDQWARSALAYLSFFGSLRSSVEPDRRRSFR